MRRALLLAVLAAPVVARGQTIPSGMIQFSKNNGQDLAHGPWINADECASATAQIYLSWNTQLASGQNAFPASVTYQVWVSNKPHTAPNCTTQPDAGTGLFAGAVGGPITATAQTQNLVAYNTSLFVTAQNNPNLSCTVQADTPIYVCVQATSGGTVVGFALGVSPNLLTLSTSRPDAPTNVTATPADDGALRISWTAPTTGISAYDYVLSATSAGDPNPHSAGDIRSLDYMMRGLINDVTYDISVYARSRAGNQSLTAGTTTGTPVAVANFWDVYHDPPPGFSGQEKGGCSSGAAGPVALLGVAALLAALRRRA